MNGYFLYLACRDRKGVKANTVSSSELSRFRLQLQAGIQRMPGQKLAGVHAATTFELQVEDP